MELDEIDAKIAELQAARADAVKRDEEKQLQSRYEEVCELVPRLIETLHRLHELGYRAPALTKAFTDGDGRYSPSSFVRRPKSTVMLQKAGTT